MDTTAWALVPCRAGTKAENRGFGAVANLAVPNYLEGQGDLISRLIMGIIRVTIWVIGVINLLTKSP